jgi:hypothetical protein
MPTFHSLSTTAACCCSVQRSPQARFIPQVPRALWQRHDQDVCWFAPSVVMNPMLPVGAVDRAMAEDPFKASEDSQL